MSGWQYTRLGELAGGFLVLEDGLARSDGSGWVSSPLEFPRPSFSIQGKFWSRPVLYPGCLRGHEFLPRLGADSVILKARNHGVPKIFTPSGESVTRSLSLRVVS